MSIPPEPDDRLSGYLDGELDAHDRAAIDSYLAQSDAWRAALAEVRWARDTVRALPWHDAPAGFWDDIASESLGATAPHRWRHPFRVAAVAAVAAAVTVFVVPTEDRDTAKRAASSTTATSSPDRSTVQSDAAGGGGDDDNMLEDLEDMVEVALDPFDW